MAKPQFKKFKQQVKEKQMENTTNEQQDTPDVNDQGIEDTTNEEVVEPVAEPTTEPVVEKITEPVVEPIITEQVKEVVVTSFTKLLVDIAEQGSNLQKRLEVSLSQYVAIMAPGIIHDHAKGAQIQYTLWKALSEVLNAEQDHDSFIATWNIVLAYFNEYDKQAFGDRFVYRFADQWRWDSDELTGFQRLINIIKLTADASKRAAGLKQVNLDRSLAEGFTDIGRQHLLSFYL